MIDEEYDTGLNTTCFMWEMLCDLLGDEELPQSLNEAWILLVKGEAIVCAKPDHKTPYVF